MGFLKKFFSGDNDEILFFILVFLFLFGSGLLGKEGNFLDGENGMILFFVVLFLLLFLGGNDAEEVQ